MPSKTDLPLSLTLHPSFSGISQPASGAATVLWRHWRSMDPARGRLNFRTRHLQLQIQGSSLGFLGEKKRNLTRTGRSKHTWCLGFLDQIFFWVWKICSKHGLEKDLFLQGEKKQRRLPMLQFHLQSGGNLPVNFSDQAPLRIARTLSQMPYPDGISKIQCQIVSNFYS